MSADHNAYTISPETLTRLGNGDMKAGRRILRAIIDLEMSHAPVNGPTPRPDCVRAATQADEDSILLLLREDFAENARHVAPMDEQRIRSFVEAATRERLATIGVIDGPSGVIGLIYLIAEQWWWSDTWYVSERLTFVSAGHRTTGRHVSNLVRFARWFVDDMAGRLGYPVFLIASVVATQDARPKTALFGRMLNVAGGIFIYPDPAPPSLN